MYIIRKDNLCRFTSFRSRPRILGGIYRPSLFFVLSPPPCRQLFEDKSKVFTGLWTTRVSAQCRLPRTRINPRSTLRFREIYSLLKDIHRKKRENVSVAKGNFLHFFLSCETRWAVGIFIAVLFRMSDYASRGAYLPVHDRRNPISHFFSSFNKDFCANNPRASVLTMELLIRQRSARSAPALAA